MDVHELLKGDNMGGSSLYGDILQFNIIYIMGYF